MKEKALKERIGAGPTDNSAGTSEVVSLSRESVERQKQKPMCAGWTIKGIPDETVDMTRMAARRRGMRIGSWVAETLHRAATMELQGIPRPESADDAVIERLDKFEELITQEMQALSEQNRALDQELAVIRRGLLPGIIGQTK